MRTFILTACIAVLLSGCAARVVNPIPEGYVGGTATIRDSFIPTESLVEGMPTRAADFYLKAVNGVEVRSAVGRANAVALAQASKMHTTPQSREVPAQALEMTLVASIEDNVPLFQLIKSGKNDHVKGRIRFTPVAGKKYIVGGQLGRNYSAVWIEDTLGNIVSKRVVSKGEGFDPEVDGLDPSRWSRVGQKPTRAQLFRRVRGGEEVETVIAKLGQPDREEYKKSNFFTSRPPLITYHYSELGQVTFFVSERKPTSVAFTKKEILLAEKPASVRAQLAAARGKEFKELANGYLHESSFNEAILDVFADEVWKRRASQEQPVISAMVSLCSAIGKSGKPRYRQFLQTISTQAYSRGLRGHAGYLAEKLGDAPAKQYRPKS